MLARLWRGVVRFRRLLAMVPWDCAGCQRANETPDLLWDALRTQLLCAHCGRMQDYPNHIRARDPRPIGRGRDAA